MVYESAAMTTGPGEDGDDDGEKQVLVTLSLAKYPFLRSKKMNEKGKIHFTGEIERSEHPDHESKETHHTVCFQDITSPKKEPRI